MINSKPNIKKFRIYALDIILLIILSYDAVAYGKDIDGDIASVKKLISGSSLFLLESGTLSRVVRTRVIDNYDTTGLSVMDLMQSPENKKFYNNRGSNNFKIVVERILNDNNFEIAIKTVKTINDNTTLRLKNVNSDFSDNFRDTITNNSKPVVFAGGLFSDLTRWEENNGLAKQIIQDGRDSWEIEITGGPNTECDTCPNYNYQQLVDYYWTALIAGVEKYSGQNKIDYVGHSNGCRVALDSLKNYSATGKNNAGYYFDTDTGTYILTDLASNPVDTFVGVACPGEFKGSSPVITAMNNFGATVINNLENSGNTHPRFLDTIPPLGEISPGGANREGRISLNLLKDYKSFIDSNTDPRPGGNLSLNSLLIVYGDTPAFSGSDFVVTTNDNIAIYNNLSSPNKNIYVTNLNHFFIANGFDVKKQIKNKLNG